MEDPDIFFNSNTLPKYKIELHIHLDGAIRTSTLWELAKEKKIDLQAESEEEFCSSLMVEEPTNLKNFLQPFERILPIIAGDLQAIERIAYEFCEDAAKENVLYAEPRYSPHLLSSGSVTPKDVVKAVNRGLARGSKNFRIHVRSILCCVRGKSAWSEEILKLCTEFKEEGVVGIDMTGDQEACMETTELDIAIFQKAASLGIHRTAHAGEDGPASQVDIAVNQMLVERIGHGYKVLDDTKVYDECLRKNIHFETCPMSSIMTGSVAIEDSKHPIIRFAEDGANFSISRDDPVLIQKSLEDDYGLLKSFGLRDIHFTRANFNALQSAFLPDEEKKSLLKELSSAYGIKLI